VTDGLRKRSLTIAGHATSISLEPAFWDELKRFAAEDGLSVAQLVADIDAARTGNLSSAIRLWILDRLKSARGP
jgi:predicted DNA-binding ribbon-helix-helix protein